MSPKNKGSVVLACSTCGSSFNAHPYRSMTAKFCSRSCAGKAQRGETAGGWRGGRGVASNGYITVYAPDAAPAGRIHQYEHRVIAARSIGRPLAAGDVVHHINGDKTDNRPENLAVMRQSDHVRLHGLPGANKKECPA